MKPLVLSLLPRPPHASRDGLAIRNYHLLAALAREFRVKALTLADPERLYEAEWPAGIDSEQIWQAPRGFRRVAAAAGSLVAGGAYSERMYRSAGAARRLREIVAAEPPRWIVAHSYHVAWAALRATRPLWIDFHNVDSEIWLRTQATAASPWLRWFARFQAGRVVALEGVLAQAAAGISCVSPRDATALRTLGARGEPLVVPNGVDLSRHAFRPEPPANETVVFVGDLSWPPNADGVRWFLSEVWPRVRAQRPSARAEIVGRSAPPALERLGGPDVRFAGEGGDARTHWLRAAVAVVPLRAGGGTRLKILEAAATGVPVVSTSVGAEGLALADESEILRRDDADAFARATVNLLGDRPAARRQAEAARARVEKEYGWGPIGEAFVRALADARPAA
jgi:polysaccharide biosynthesis protein PslH